MRAPHLKLLVWVAVVTTLCWCWVFVPNWRTFAQVALIVSPILLSQRRQFQERVSAPGIAFVLLVVAILLVSAVTGWSAHSNRWFDLTELRPILGIFTWSVFVAVGHYAIIKRRAA